MKKYLFLIALVFFSGCAHNPMRYNLAPGTTQQDFNKAIIECGGSDQAEGGFIFGPAIIILPVIAVIESIRFAKKHKLQDCLEDKGFKCTENCAHVSIIKP